MPYLIFNYYDNQPEIFELLSEVNTLGRAFDNIIAIKNNTVSRYHAIIEITENKIIIKDLQSINKTLVNQTQIAQCQLNDGDIISLGNVEFKFVKNLENSAINTQAQQKLDKQSLIASKKITIKNRNYPIQELITDELVNSSSVIKLKENDPNNKLKVLLEVSKELSCPDDQETVLEKILALLFTILDVDRAAILLLNENTGELEVNASKARGDIEIAGEFYSKQIINWVYTNGKALATADACNDSRLIYSESIMTQHIRASMCIPLMKQGDEIIGILYMDNLNLSAIYSDEDVKFVSALANQAALAINNAKLYAKLREKEQLLTQFLSAIPVGISVHKTDGQMYYANQMAQHLLGFDTLPPASIDQISECYQIYRTGGEHLYPTEKLPIVQAISGSRVKSDDLELHQLDKTIPIEMSAIPLVDETGKIEYAIAAFQDITERKQVEKLIADYNHTLEVQVNQRTQELQETLEKLQTAQKQLVEAEKMAALGQLVAGVAHEINTPIGISVMAASTLEEMTQEFSTIYHSGKMKRSQLEQFIHTAQPSSTMILNNLHRASELINSFKQVAVDQSSENKRHFKIKPYLQEILLSLHPKLKLTKQIVKLKGNNHISLDSYPGAFSQIITNFVLNSLIHAYEPQDYGCIIIDIQEEEENIILSYSDDGKGIHEDDVSKIFEPFFTTKRGQGGTGLGLHLVYNLVTQKLKGTIVCNSQLGMGTEFIIKIPQ